VIFISLLFNSFTLHILENLLAQTLMLSMFIFLFFYVLIN